MIWNKWSGAATAAAMCLASAFVSAGAEAAPPANNDCANTQAITGSGPFNFDLTEATTGPNGAIAPLCDAAVGIGIGHDVWYCWTSTCNGFVEISTCGLTQVDTKIRFYTGCACPADVSQPLCCADDDCAAQTKLVCDVTCGQTYLIQLGTKPNTPGGTGAFTITCIDETCATVEPGPCDCCGARPPLVEQLTTPFNPGLLAAVTNFQIGPNDPAVYVIDLGNQGSAPLGLPWNTAKHTDPAWTMARLGGVFGVTLDDVGNVYVAHTSCYDSSIGGLDPLGALGGAGSIYRLDGATAAATELIRLPNQLDPFWFPSQPGQAYPGLGNLSFDCDTGRLFAANLEDGRIYSIDPTGGPSMVKSTFNIIDGAIAGPLPNNALAEPGDLPGWVPLGERPYAVKAHNGRLYYSVWSGDVGIGSPNTIRSVQLNGLGNFVSGTDQLEVTMSALPGYAGSNPVVDITFDDDCCLYAAERGVMEIGSNAHSSRVMKFCEVAGGTFDQIGTLYSIGDAGCIGPYNSAGGVGFEVGANMVWSMGDALRICASPFVYGLQGQPVAGAPIAASILVDMDGNLGSFQKNLLGSLDVNCLTAVPPCSEIVDGEILCKQDGSFNYTFTLTNQSGQTAAVLILPDPAFSPNVFPLNPPLANGSSTTVTVNINGPLPGSQFCFPIILGSVKGEECCHIDHCVDLPDCECAQISHVGIQATSTPGTFILNFTITNLEAWNMGHLVLFPTGGLGSINPSLINVPSTPTWGSQNIGPITVTSGAAPGTQFCITIGNHSVDWLLCCFVELCVTVPTPSPSGNPADLDQDGDVDAADLAILLGAWGSGGTGDINGDGTVNGADLAILLSAWGS